MSKITYLRYVCMYLIFSGAVGDVLVRLGRPLRGLDAECGGGLPIETHTQPLCWTEQMSQRASSDFNAHGMGPATSGFQRFPTARAGDVKLRRWG